MSLRPWRYSCSSIGVRVAGVRGDDTPVRVLHRDGTRITFSGGRLGRRRLGGRGSGRRLILRRLCGRGRRSRFRRCGARCFRRRSRRRRSLTVTRRSCQYPRRCSTCSADIEPPRSVDRAQSCSASSWFWALMEPEPSPNLHERKPHARMNVLDALNQTTRRFLQLVHTLTTSCADLLSQSAASASREDGSFSSAEQSHPSDASTPNSWCSHPSNTRPQMITIFSPVATSAIKELCTVTDAPNRAQVTSR